MLALFHPMPQKGKGHLRDPELRRLRAIKMLDAKVVGAMSLPAIAEKFNVSTKTVERTLDWAKRAGLVADYEDEILQTLVPSAISAFAVALENGDTQVALEVLKGTGLLKKQSDKPLVPAQAQNENDLAGYIRQIRGGTDANRIANRKPLAELVAAPDPSTGATDVVDADVVEDPDEDTPPAAPGLRPAGGEGRTTDADPGVVAPADDAGLPNEPATHN